MYLRKRLRPTKPLSSKQKRTTDISKLGNQNAWSDQIVMAKPRRLLVEPIHNHYPLPRRMCDVRQHSGYTIPTVETIQSTVTAEDIS